MHAVMPTYGRIQIAFERGEGAYLYTPEGERYLDFAAGIAVNSLGHSHPALVAALQEQAGRLWHVSNLYQIPGQIRYAERLTAACFADAAFFCNSGAEAVEGAIKAARRYHAVNGAPERYRSVTLQGSFHGRTLATLSASKNPKHLDGFGPPAEGFDIVPVNNLNELRNAITGETASIVAEPVQGEGGVRPLEPDYLRALREIADEFGVLLVLDEVQTGFGRTGKLFAHEWAGIVPDVMAVAKGIAGGFPCGAVLASERVAMAMTPGTHGSTFGGNPLAMSAANAVFDVIEQAGFLDHVQRMGKRLEDGLQALARKYPEVIAGVRGKGLLIGIVVRAPYLNGQLGDAARANKLLTVGAGENVLRLLPPLNIGDTEAEEALAALDAACAALQSGSDGA